MRIAVIGAGALGSLFAGLLRLAQPGDDIWLLGGLTSRPHRQKIAQAGLRIEIAPNMAEAWTNRPQFPATSYQIKGLRIAEEPEELGGPVDLAIVLVKSYQTERAAQQAARLLSPGGLALTLQNGLGNAETLTAQLGQERVAQGVTVLGATVLEPGVIRASGYGPTSLGQSPRLAPTAAALLSDFAERLQTGAGLPVVVSEDVAGIVWGKLIVNTAVNPLAALMNCTNGELLDDPNTLKIMDEAATETAAVAVAAGIKLPFPPEEAAQRARQAARINTANINSMLADVRAGHPTEIEAINGAVVQLGQKLSVATPVNRSLYNLVLKTFGSQKS